MDDAVCVQKYEGGADLRARRLQGPMTVGGGERGGDKTYIEQVRQIVYKEREG